MKRSVVVVIHPALIAIALEYRDSETPLLISLRHGGNLIGRRRIETAKQEGIPEMENAPLMRALHEQPSLDQ